MSKRAACLIATIILVPSTYAACLATTSPTTFGYSLQGASIGTTMSNSVSATRYEMAGQNGTVSSMSVFVASPVSAPPNNQFQVAIYADNNGTPGALVASSVSQTIVPDAWNTVPISAPVAANAYYWLAYNKNGLAANTTNLRYDAGGGAAKWISPEPFGTWPATFGRIGGTSSYRASIYAAVLSIATPDTFGYSVQGASIGTTMSNSVSATRYEMAGQNGTVSSMSVFVASPVSAPPNNQFQVAIYADNNGTPGALIASSVSQTIVPDAWNTVPISAPVAANAYYWLAYNTNGLAANTNNLRYDAGGATSVWISLEPFGTWPATFGPIGSASRYRASIYATLLSITSTSLPNGTVGVAYSTTFSATGGTPSYTWSLTTGSLPPGLALSTSGAVSGAPTAAGSSSFTTQASDSGGQKASHAFAVSVASLLSITSTSLPSGTVGVAYSTTFSATGGTPPYTWSLTTGSLPPGLALSTSGTVSGMPTAVGSYSFTIQAADSVGQKASQAFAVSIASLLITTTSLPSGTVGVAYSATLSATGGTPPYTWSLTTGSLPPGLALSTSGTVSGMPTAVGSYSFTLQAADSVGQKASQDISRG